MKQTFKFAMVALAVVGLASCSSDDFFGNGEQAQLKKNGISVTVDDMIDPATMRSALAPVGETKNNEWYWQKGDQIRMYDETLGKYDDYTCNEKGEFILTLPEGHQRNGAAIKEPKYALFYNAGGTTPTTDAKLEWNEKTDELYAKFTIPTYIKWGEEAVGANDAVDAYLSYLPLWGEAYTDAEKQIGATLHYLTAVVRINLENVPGNAKYITVEGEVEGDANGGKPARMTGIFTAVLSKFGAAPTKATVKLDPETQTGTPGNKITVNITSAKRDQSVVYVPMISQKYKTVTMKAWAEQDDMTSGEPIATEVKSNAYLEHGTVYPIDLKKFDIAGGDITSINDALKKQAEKEGTVTIKASKVTAVKDNDYVLEIPNMKASEVVIDLKGLNANPTTQDLHIKYLNASEPYEGNLVIDVDKDQPFSNNIYVNLPKTRVTFSGAGLKEATLGGSEASNNLNVKQLTIGPALNPGEDGTDLTVVKVAYVNKEVGANNTTDLEDVIISENATLTTLTLKGGKDTTVKSVAVQGTLSSWLDVSKDFGDKVITVTVGNKANIKQGFATNQKQVTIQGQAKVSRDDQMRYDAIILAKGGEVYVSGTATAEGDSVVVDGNIKIVGEGTFTVKGASNVSTLKAEAAEGAETTGVTTVTVGNTATVGTIDTPDADVTFNNFATSTVEVKAKTLEMNYVTSVKKATVTGDVTIANTKENIAVTGELNMIKGEQTLTLTGGYINYINAKDLIIVNEETCQTAIRATGNIFNLKEAEDGNTYTSVWCGKTISDDAAYAEYAGAQNIYTASHLASLTLGQGNTANLMANMDLNSKNWPMIALERSFNGGDKTIKNLKNNQRTENNVGLFSTAKDKLAIQKLTIEDATVTGVDNVGALVGQALGDLTVTDVTIKKGENKLLIQSDADAKGENIGGVVGYAVGTPTFTNITVTDAAVKGQYNLGGIIGYGAKHVMVNGSQDQIQVKFTVLDPVTEPNYHADRDLKAGTVGVYVGKVANALTVDAKHSSTGDLLKNKRSGLGFRARWDIKTSETEPTKWYVWYGSYTGDVGECGQYTITGETTESDKGWYENAAAIESAKAANAYIQDIVTGGGTPTNSDLRF